MEEEDDDDDDDELIVITLRCKMMFLIETSGFLSPQNVLFRYIIISTNTVIIITNITDKTPINSGHKTNT